MGCGPFEEIAVVASGHLSGFDLGRVLFVFDFFRGFVAPLAVIGLDDSTTASLPTLSLELLMSGCKGMPSSSSLKSYIGSI
jgi:hypothetical protein